MCLFKKNTHTHLYTFCLYYSAAIYTNRHYLAIYRRTHPERLAVNGEGKPKVTGDVFIHPTAQVHPTAVVCVLLFMNVHFFKLQGLL